MMEGRKPHPHSSPPLLPNNGLSSSDLMDALSALLIERVKASGANWQVLSQGVRDVGRLSLSALQWFTEVPLKPAPPCQWKCERLPKNVNSHRKWAHGAHGAGVHCISLYGAEAQKNATTSANRRLGL